MRLLVRTPHCVFNKSVAQRLNVQRGVALAVLLWMLAALSLMAAGIVLMARIDVRLAQIQTKEAQAAALGDGAVHLLMRDMARLQREGQYDQRGILVNSYQLADSQIHVRAVPLAGLIDINQASEYLWLDTLVYAAGLDEAAAIALTEKILAWRNALDVAGDEAEEAPRNGRFEVIEDMLLVPGMTRELFEQLRLVVHAYSGTAGIDLSSAPSPVLRILARGDDALVRQFNAERAADPMMSWDGYSGMNPDFLQPSTSTFFRVDARVLQKDGTISQRSRWVQTGVSGRDLLPWKLLRAEPVITVKTLEFTTIEEAHGTQ